LDKKTAWTGWTLATVAGNKIAARKMAERLGERPADFLKLVSKSGYFQAE
jgi:hypothetical protein